MKLLYVGNLTPGSRSEQRRRAFVRLGHDVDALPYCATLSSYAERPRPSLADRVRHRLGRPSDPMDVNGQLLRALCAARYDAVWVDKAPPLLPRTLQRAKELSAGTIFHFHSEDNHALPHNQWAWISPCFAQYDVVWTTKKHNVERGELAALGARDVRFHFQSFDPLDHRPLQPDPFERDHLFADAGFIGTFEAERARSLLALADAGVFVRVFGNGWKPLVGQHALLVVHPHEVSGREYLAAMACSSVQLGFLRKQNLDEHTSRSVEIPACGVPLVAERTGDHLALFEEGKEALFFDGDRELVASVQDLLAHPERRRALAIAGRERCLESGYDHDAMLARCLAATMPDVDPAPALAEHAA
ncbi:MAG: glycosyltransferase [Planctomycetaceae bacterium]|nr:glycosyltransferase [Planctomycetaceae bacterium]